MRLQLKIETLTHLHRSVWFVGPGDLEFFVLQTDIHEFLGAACKNVVLRFK